jgi:hypothetical protein
LSPEKLDRWERIYGRVNFYNDYDFGQGLIRIIVLNTLNMDSPATFTELQEETFSFLETIPKPESENFAVVLLTHIPLFKPAGFCVDEPHTDYWWDAGPIQEQTHLTQVSSDWILDNIFSSLEGGAVPGLILTGHDHEGCDVVHYMERENAHNETDVQLEEIVWKQAMYNTSTANLVCNGNAVREITVRSMMGDFGGNVGLVNAWNDEKNGKNI